MATDTELREMVAAQRREVADLMAGLDAEQIGSPSLCAGWSVKDVAAYLTIPFHTSMPKFDKVLKRKRFDGIRLEATDQDYTSGNGATVSGTSEAILMTMLSRPSALDDLTGDGVSLLRSRMAS